MIAKTTVLSLIRNCFIKGLEFDYFYYLLTQSIPTTYSSFSLCIFTSTEKHKSLQFLIFIVIWEQRSLLNHYSRWNHLTMWKWCECDPFSGEDALLTPSCLSLPLPSQPAMPFTSSSQTSCQLSAAAAYAAHCCKAVEVTTGRGAHGPGWAFSLSLLLSKLVMFEAFQENHKVW